MRKLFIIIPAVLVLTLILASCGKQEIEPSIEEETTSMEESSELESSIAESSAEKSSKLAVSSSKPTTSSKPASSSSKAPAPSSVTPTPPPASSQPTGGTDERMNSRAFYDALVPKATAMGYKCEWLGQQQRTNGLIVQIGKFTLPSGFWIQIEYRNTDNRGPTVACYFSTGGSTSSKSGSYDICFNHVIAVLNACKSE